MVTRTRLPIRVATVQRGDIVSTFSTNGIVEPISNFEAHAPYAGLVKAVFVHEGDRVPEGKLLVEMDNTEGLTREAHALCRSARCPGKLRLPHQRRQPAGALYTGGRRSPDESGPRPGGKPACHAQETGRAGRRLRRRSRSRAAAPRSGQRLTPPARTSPKVSL